MSASRHTVHQAFMNGSRYTGKKRSKFRPAMPKVSLSDPGPQRRRAEHEARTREQLLAEATRTTFVTEYLP